MQCMHIPYHPAMVLYTLSDIASDICRTIYLRNLVILQLVDLASNGAKARGYQPKLTTNLHHQAHYSDVETYDACAAVNSREYLTAKGYLEVRAALKVESVPDVERQITAMQTLVRLSFVFDPYKDGSAREAGAGGEARHEEDDAK